MKPAPPAFTNDAGSTPPRRFLVTGTGTGVGKTYVTRSLLHALRSRHPRSLALKPIESGYQALSSDAASLTLEPPIIEPRYALSAALSPHRAADLAKTSIDLGEVVGWIDDLERARQLSLTLIETAGGLFTPLTPRETNLDLVRALEPCTWLLVAPNRLGVLHDVQASVRAARAEHRAPDAVVLNTPVADESSPSNLEDLNQLQLGPLVFPFSTPLAHPLLGWLEARANPNHAPAVNL